MYRFIPLSLLALLVLALPASGQRTVVVHGGLAFTEFAGAGAAGTDSRTGLHLGAGFAFPMTGGLEIRLGLDYTAKGVEGTGTVPNGTEVPAALKVDYVEVPLLLQYGFDLGPRLGLHLLGGAVVSVETSCEASVTLGGEPLAGDCGDATDDLDLGLAGGVGLSFPISSSVDLTGEVLYNGGLRSVAAADDLKNRALLVRVGLAIPVGR